jgi:glycosyltransferase involved in cell wall biosynthesis
MWQKSLFRAASRTIAEGVGGREGSAERVGQGRKFTDQPAPPALTAVAARHRVAFYVDSTTVGGAEIVLRDLVETLDARFEVTVIGADETVVDTVAGWRAGAERVVVPPILSRRDFAAMRAHRRLFKLLRPEILHVNLHHLGSCQWTLLVARTVPSIRVVAVEHSLVPAGSLSSRLLKRLTSRLLHAHVAVGERSAREVERIVGLRRGQVSTIHNGVHKRRPVAHNGQAGRLQLGWIGRFDRAKGIDVLLDALVDVPEATLLLVGEGDEEPALRAQVARLALDDRVEFRAWSDDARAELDAVDVFVLPSRSESFPLTVLEAMIVALPVVASDVGSVSEAVVDGKTGLLVPPDDAPALSAALRSLADDPELRARMGRAGREVANGRFDVPTMTRQYEALYVALTESRR